MTPIPDGYHTVTPYLVVSDPAALIDFVVQAFGASERTRMAGPDGSIMHAEVIIGDSVIMLGGTSDKVGVFPGVIHLYLDDVDAYYRRALEAGATPLRAPADQAYGDRSAGVNDEWANQWWIAAPIAPPAG